MIQAAIHMMAPKLEHTTQRKRHIGVYQLHDDHKNRLMFLNSSWNSVMCGSLQNRK